MIFRGKREGDFWKKVCFLEKLRGVTFGGDGVSSNFLERNFEREAQEIIFDREGWGVIFGERGDFFGGELWKRRG